MSRVSGEAPRSQEQPRVITTIGVGAIGVALVVAALAANRQWLDRHFLPSFFLPRSQYMQIQSAVRLGIATIGVALALMARSAARLLTARNMRLALSMGVAAILALAASEFVLRYWSIGPSEWLVNEDEPRRRPDPRLGWTLVPARVGHKMIGGRTLEYAVDPAGYRVRSFDEPVDPVHVIPVPRDEGIDAERRERVDHRPSLREQRLRRALQGVADVHEQHSTLAFATNSLDDGRDPRDTTDGAAGRT